MTEGPEDIALAAQALSQGEAASAKHVADVQSMEASIAGSEEWTEQPTSLDEQADSWPTYTPAHGRVAAAGEFAERARPARQ